MCPFQDWGMAYVRSDAAISEAGAAASQIKLVRSDWALIIPKHQPTPTQLCAWPVGCTTMQLYRVLKIATGYLDLKQVIYRRNGVALSGLEEGEGGVPSGRCSGACMRGVVSHSRHGWPSHDPSSQFFYLATPRSTPQVCQ